MNMNRRDLQWPAIKALQHLGGQDHRSNIRDFIIKDLGLTTAQVNARSGVRNNKTFNTGTSWALHSLKTAGYIIGVPAGGKSGNWKLTPKGQKATEGQFPI